MSRHHRLEAVLDEGRADSSALLSRDDRRRAQDEHVHQALRSVERNSRREPVVAVTPEGREIANRS